MSQAILNYSESSDVLGSYPRAVSWFIDRTGDPTILEGLTPRRISWAESDQTILEEQGLIQPYRAIINNARYFENSAIANAVAAAAANINIINSDIINNFRNIVIDPMYVNTIVSVVVDEDMEVTEEQQDCCICFEKKDKTDICILRCSHSFCVDCSSRHCDAQYRRSENISCSLCRAEVTNIRVQSIAKRDKFLMR